MTFEQRLEGVGKLTIHTFGEKAFEARGRDSSKSAQVHGQLGKKTGSPRGWSSEGRGEGHEVKGETGPERSCGTLMLKQDLGFS